MTIRDGTERRRLGRAAIIYEPMLVKHPPSHYLKMMYLESTCYHLPAARCAFETVGPDKFIFGTDAPPLWSSRGVAFK